MDKTTRLYTRRSLEDRQRQDPFCGCQRNFLGGMGHSRYSILLGIVCPRIKQLKSAKWLGAWGNYILFALSWQCANWIGYWNDWFSQEKVDKQTHTACSGQLCFVCQGTAINSGDSIQNASWRNRIIAYWHKRNQDVYGLAFTILWGKHVPVERHKDCGNLFQLFLLIAENSHPPGLLNWSWTLILTSGMHGCWLVYAMSTQQRLS